MCICTYTYIPQSQTDKSCRTYGIAVANIRKRIYIHINSIQMYISIYANVYICRGVCIYLHIILKTRANGINIQ